MATTALQMSEISDCLPRAAAPTKQRRECVLLIEDNEDAMFLVRYAFQEYGQGKYRLIWAKRLTRISHNDVTEGRPIEPKHF